MTSQREAFEKWWGDKPQEYKLDMTTDEKLSMWVWGAWQAAQADQAERVKELEAELLVTQNDDDVYCNEMEATIAQLQLENQKLREALEVCKYDCQTGEVIGIAKEALGETK